MRFLRLYLLTFSSSSSSFFDPSHLLPIYPPPLSLWPYDQGNCLLCTVVINTGCWLLTFSSFSLCILGLLAPPFSVRVAKSITLWPCTSPGYYTTPLWPSSPGIKHRSGFPGSLLLGRRRTSVLKRCWLWWHECLGVLTSILTSTWTLQAPGL
ncbi:MAG: hypothetical protein J3Q66DRAFT_349709 [Benniella sp.]|nr:MAG: hypothetical protein J3Q66DRAFT_349415 [Benniella sp.]KAK3812208.1 MAG: hypothetical protein J3Q66DRAFT_349709 [Benniella sp.]